jgi:hypothetical protein
MPRAKRNLAETLAPATNKRQGELASLRKRVAQLEATQGGISSIEISKIHPSPWQARQSIHPAIIQSRAISLLIEGQKEPIVIYRIDDPDQYKIALGKHLDKKSVKELIEKIKTGSITHFIEDGELRFRAAQILLEQGHGEWAELKFVESESPANPNEIHHRSLIHGLHYTELNPLDQIEGLIRQLQFRLSDQLTGNDGEQVETIVSAIRLLHNTLAKVEGAKSRLEAISNHTGEVQQDLAQALIEELSTPKRPLGSLHTDILVYFSRLQLNIISVATNNLGVFRLSNSLKVAIRRKGLGCSQAVKINSVHARKWNLPLKQRQSLEAELIREVIAQGLSKQGTQNLVKEKIEAILGTDDIASKENGSKEIQPLEPTQGNSLQEVQRIESALAIDLSKLENNSLEHLKVILEAKLAEIANLA